MRWLVFKLVLTPLIRRNYGMRERGTLPDQLYWADVLAFGWGYAVDVK